MMKARKLIAVFLVLLMAAGIAGCSTGGVTIVIPGPVREDTSIVYPFTIIDSYGREVVIEKEPLRVISLAPSITETIFALGAEDKLVGRTDFCSYPREVSNFESIGGLRDPNIEKITELNPDIIIASTHFQKEVLELLEQLQFKVVVLYGEESFDGVYETIEKTGVVLNRVVKAEKIVSEMKEKVDYVTGKVRGAKTPSVYYVVGFGEWGDFTAGNGTFIGRMIEMAGGANAAGDVDGWMYSLERLVENNPDILIGSVSDNHDVELRKANGYKDLDAVKNNRLYVIDKNLLELQGPRLADGLLELARIIHPDLFK